MIVWVIESIHGTYRMKNNYFTSNENEAETFATEKLAKDALEYEVVDCKPVQIEIKEV